MWVSVALTTMWTAGFSVAVAKDAADDDPPRDEHTTPAEDREDREDFVDETVREAKRHIGVNMFGGRVVQRPLLVLSSGLPHALQVDARFPAGAAELGLFARFDFANDAVQIDPGTGAGIDTRILLVSRDAWDVALHLAGIFDARFNNTPQFSVEVGNPGVFVSRNFNGMFDIDFGVEVRPSLVFGPRTQLGNRPHDLHVNVAVPLLIGIEGDVSERVQVGWTLEGGPEIRPRANDVSVGPWVRSLLHVGFEI
jgi:hypothetical protein